MNKVAIKLPKADLFFKAEEVDEYGKKALQARDTLLQGSGKGNDFLGWTSLPETIDPAIVSSIKEDAKRIKANSQLFVVVGIGGSYLGARAVIEALQSELQSLDKNRNTPLVVYAGHTLSEDYCAQLLSVLDNYDYSVAVISKSGTTTEPAIAFRLIKKHIENKYGKEQARERIYAITDAEKGALHEIAIIEGYKRYIIPDNVGGRFSVLTPVGLLPIAAAGLDIDQLLAGARDMRKVCVEAPFAENPALQYAAIRNLLYSKGKKVEVLVNFLPNLKYISEWWKQLYGESEGKENKGILPHSLSFTTDLHSMGQYVQEGERLLFETLISVDGSHCHVDIPTDEKNLDKLNYLTSKTLTEINHCAETGTMIAHRNGGVPIVEIHIPEVTEYTLGQLIYMFEFACGVSGYMLGVNPFDQPGVEAYKKNMFALLGKPGFEELRKTLVEQ
ncbi:MAG: glucose-6-phosphate isomerase [Bacteroidales bacterium]|nr:glucose-6-phosphate isomerase [Bacteroidales bacterium]